MTQWIIVGLTALTLVAGVYASIVIPQRIRDRKRDVEFGILKEKVKSLEGEFKRNEAQFESYRAEVRSEHGETKSMLSGVKGSVDTLTAVFDERFESIKGWVESVESRVQRLEDAKK